MSIKPEDWLEKGEGDFKIAVQLLSLSDPAFQDGICYHCQQCIEKLIKGLLLKRGIPFPKVHDLRLLGEMLSQSQPELVLAEEDLDFLTEAGVAFRYPGISASLAHAEKAFELCSRLRDRLLTYL